MSSEAVQLAAERLLSEEAYRQYPYNDATGKRVTCLPAGNLSWLIGLNLEVIGSIELAEVVLKTLLEQRDKRLSMFWWYGALDDVRLSVILDVSYNTGTDGLLHFPKMLAAVGAKNWAVAHDELLDSEAARNPRLKKRYEALAEILLSGVNV